MLVNNQHLEIERRPALVTQSLLVHTLVMQVLIIMNSQKTSIFKKLIGKESDLPKTECAAEIYLMVI
jgi:DNA-directed RNA polymerase subunit H (RpoH/RPB5)